MEVARQNGTTGVVKFNKWAKKLSPHTTVWDVGSWEDRGIYLFIDQILWNT